MSTTAKQTKINTAAKAEITNSIASAGATSGGARSTVASGTKAEGASPGGRSYILKRAGSGKVRAVLEAQGPAPETMTPSAPTTAPTAPGSNGMKADIIYLSMDVHADRQVVVVQVDATTPKPAQSMDIKALHVLAGKQLQQAHRVVACYEAGLCGYSLCRALIALGHRVHGGAAEVLG